MTGGAPRVCGDDPSEHAPTHSSMAVLPAYAGMIQFFRANPRRKAGAPRVCGDDPPGVVQRFSPNVVLPAYAGMIPYCDELGQLDGWECSPRMRG